MTLAPKRKPITTIHHKRRVGAHHHRNSKHYTKPYWPYLPLLLIVGAGLLLSSVWGERGHVLGDSTKFSSNQLLVDTNAQRIADHETGLSLNTQLSEAAQKKADDMAARNYWSHDTPDGKSPWTFIDATGYGYMTAGENLAYGFDSGQALINGWMHSPEHRENLLNRSFEDVGFGVATSPNFQNGGRETIVVAIYAQPSTMNISAEVLPHATQAEIRPQPPSVTVARVQTLTAGESWSLAVIGTLGVLACMWYMARHAFAVKRVLIHGEEYILHHHFLDFVVVTVATIAFVLTQTGGFIH